MRIKLGKAARLAAVLVLASPLLGGADCLAEEDRWAPLRPLLGQWQGEGAGFGSTSKVTHRWELVLQGKFLRLATRSQSRKQDGTEEVHEDLGYLSQDTDRHAFVFRQFLSEGFVNTYDIRLETQEKLRILFDDREAESAGGMRARMHLTFNTDDEYDMVLELAAPGKDFTPCQEMKMKRVP